MENLSEEANAASESKTSLENAVRDALIPVKSKERERGLLARELAQEKKKRDNAVRRLEQARRQILESQGNVAEEERERTRKIAKAESDLARLKEQVEPLREEQVVHLRLYQEIEPALTQMKETLDGTKRQLNAVQQKVNAMQQDSGEGKAALAMFGSKCKALYEVCLNASFLFFCVKYSVDVCSNSFPKRRCHNISHVHFLLTSIHRQFKRHPRRTNLRDPLLVLWGCTSRSSAARRNMPKSPSWPSVEAHWIGSL